MILGVGLDMVAVEGFARQLADPASTFVQGTFTEQERRAAHARPSGRPEVHLAARFAAKEAFIKAWSTARLGRAPALSHVDLRQIEVFHDDYGRPALQLHGEVARAVGALGAVRAHLSLTHDGPMAAAVVVLELIPA